MQVGEKAPNHRDLDVGGFQFVEVRFFGTGDELQELGQIALVRRNGVERRVTIELQIPEKVFQYFFHPTPLRP